MDESTAVVLFPGGDTEPDGDLAEIERFRARWDPQATLIGAHVTVVFPFAWPGSSEELRAVLVDVAARHRPFTLELGDPTRWEEEYVFLLARAGGDETADLHADLYASVPGPVATRPFTPHLTIARSADPAVIAAALPAAASLSLAFPARAMSVFRGRRRDFDVPLTGR